MLDNCDLVELASRGTTFTFTILSHSFFNNGSFDCTVKNVLQTVLRWVAAIAPWFRLRLPSCSPRFKSQAHHLHFFQLVLLKLCRENTENKQKEAGIGPFLKTLLRLLRLFVLKISWSLVADIM